MGLQKSEIQLKFTLDEKLGSLSPQIAEHIRQAISAGELKAGDRIPASRKLANDLGVARGTVTVAIDLLVAEGVLEAHPGSGTYVSHAAADLFTSERACRVEGAVQPPQSVPQPDIDIEVRNVIDFRPCRPSLEAFPVQIWRRCMSAAVSSVPSSDYGDPRGDEMLRQNILDYLRRARGLSATTDQIIITNGSVHAMHILSRLYLDEAANVVVENPGYPLARQTFELCKAGIIACPVDENGLRTDELPDKNHNVKFVCVTPSHQFPTGYRLSLERRRALIEWADANGALIIEDDYDGEFRYDVPPLAPLAALSPDSVVYCGTFSKTMFPGLRIGFAIAHREVIDAIAAYRTISEYAPNAPLQKALSIFIADGHFAKHIYRMNRIYASKRRRVADTLKELNAPAKLTGLDSGLSVLMTLTGSMSASNLSGRAQQNGVLVPPVSRYDALKKLTDDALVLGYASASEEEISMGIEHLFKV
ncbi:MAG: PLP-dependent aminotransferase family protein [Parvibaculaceae bacterium]